MTSDRSTSPKYSKESTPKKYRVAQYFAIRAITDFTISPDGKTIAYITNTNGLPNIWTIPIDGGWANQITLEENAVFSIGYNPKRNEIVFSSDIIFMMIYFGL